MKYATVVTTAQEIENSVPHTYLISPADEDGNPQEGKAGQFARVKFETDQSHGCSELDVLAVVMHRLAASGADARAMDHLESAMYHLSTPEEPTQHQNQNESNAGFPMGMLTERL
jgi:hypothetical protein